MSAETPSVRRGESTDKPRATVPVAVDQRLRSPLMEYFVTGATGLVGSHLVGQLVSESHDVVTLTRSRSNAAHLPETVTVVEGDLTDKESMRRAMEGVDGVFHAGAWFYAGPGAERGETARRVNVEGTRCCIR